jgi:hypothetical protein
MKVLLVQLGAMGEYYLHTLRIILNVIRQSSANVTGGCAVRRGHIGAWV